MLSKHMLRRKMYSVSLYLYIKRKCFNINLNYIIRYAGSILNNSNRDLIIFSGTVYQEILIWQINYNYHSRISPVLHRLQGHNVRNILPKAMSFFMHCVKV